jgi:hypothetical protein
MVTDYNLFFEKKVKMAQNQCSKFNTDVEGEVLDASMQ